jgi:polysaccharide export outer membrane protein
MRAAVLGLTLLTTALTVSAAHAQAAQGVQQRDARAAAGAPKSAPAAAASTATVTGVELPPGYVIGLEDVMDVVIWKEKDMSAENVVVRPDGKISLPLVNDIPAVGLSVEQLRANISQAVSKLVPEGEVSVVIKQIRSRRVTISGQVAKQGQYPLLSRMTVVDLISTAGGAAEYANTEKILIVRKENGKDVPHTFNYKDYMKGKPAALAQNIELQPNDIVTVP